MCVYEKLGELGYSLPEPPPPGGLYEPVKAFGEKLLYTSGVGPTQNGKPVYTGKVGAELSLEEAGKAAVLTTLNLLSVLHRHIGDLNKIKSIVKMLAFVASADDFYSRPAVMNYSTGLLIELFGRGTGCPARSAIGVNVLPGNIPVEIELLVELK